MQESRSSGGPKVSRFAFVVPYETYVDTKEDDVLSMGGKRESRREAGEPKRRRAQMHQVKLAMKA